MFNTSLTDISKCIKEEGIDTVFGITGVELSPLLKEFTRNNLRVVSCVNELNASFMAASYFQVTGRVGVCFAIPGPGVTNMITGIATASCESIPMIVIVPQTKQKRKNQFFFVHEMNHRETLSSVASDYIEIEQAEGAYDNFKKAFVAAKKNGGGPVVVEISIPLLNEDVLSKSDVLIEEESKRIELDVEKRAIIKKLISESKKIGIYLGKGAINASLEIQEFSEKFSAPIATTASGKGVVSENFKHSVGFGFGPGSSSVAQKIFNDCEVLIAVGCRFSEISSSCYLMKVPDKLIHIDINPAVFDKNYTSRISICMDAKDAMRELLNACIDIDAKLNSSLEKEIAVLRKKTSTKYETGLNKNKVSPEKFFMGLRKQLRNDAILTLDCGFNQFWGIEAFPVYEPRSFVTSVNFQVMGYALPAAISAKLANPQKHVVCVCGDGGFNMSCLEILTACREKIKIDVFIFKDSSFGLIKGIESRRYSRSFATDFINPDFEFLAKALKVNYQKISTDLEISPVVKNVLESKEINIVEVNVCYKKLPQYFQEIMISKFLSMPLKDKLQAFIEKCF